MNNIIRILCVLGIAHSTAGFSKDFDDSIGILGAGSLTRLTSQSSFNIRPKFAVTSDFRISKHIWFNPQIAYAFYGISEGAGSDQYIEFIFHIKPKFSITEAVTFHFVIGDVFGINVKKTGTNRKLHVAIDVGMGLEYRFVERWSANVQTLFENGVFNVINSSDSMWLAVQFLAGVNYHF